MSQADDDLRGWHGMGPRAAIRAPEGESSKASAERLVEQSRRCDMVASQAIKDADRGFLGKEVSIHDIAWHAARMAFDNYGASNNGLESVDPLKAVSAIDMKYLRIGGLYLRDNIFLRLSPAMFNRFCERRYLRISMRSKPLEVALKDFVPSDSVTIDSCVFVPHFNDGRVDGATCESGDPRLVCDYVYQGVHGILPIELVPEIVSFDAVYYSKNEKTAL